MKGLSVDQLNNLPTSADDGPLLIEREMAALLRISPRHVKRLVKLPENPLPSLELPGLKGKRFIRADVLAWIQRGKVGGAQHV